MDLLFDIKYAMLPEAIVTLLIIVCSILTLLSGYKQRIIYYVATVGLFLVLFAFNLTPVVTETAVLYNSFVSNMFTVIFRILIVIGSLIVIQMSKKYTSVFGNSIGEFYVLLLIATLGAMLLAGANDLVMVFVALETLSISSFALCGYTKLDKLSNEAALKYIIIGAASSAVMLYGFSFIYGITGQTNLTIISSFINSGYQVNAVLIIAFLLMLGGLGYKLAAVPFHSWAPDVYQGAPLPVAAFLSVVSKLAGFAVIIRVLSIFAGSVPVWSLGIAVIAVLTMTIGNLMAVGQTNIRRLMAYSSIAQAGYVLVGLAIATQAGISSMIFYLIAYLFTNFGAWAAIEMHMNQVGKDSIDAFDGLAFKQPALGFGLTVCLLSLAGIPLTAGFFAKLYLFQAVMFGGFQYIWLLIIALINSVIAVYYYLKIVRAMFLKPQYHEQITILPPSKTLNIVLGFTTIAVITVGLLASPFISISQAGASNINLPASSTNLQ